MKKTIVTAALTGAVTPSGYHIPETPEQIAEEAYEVWKLGAAIVHLHMRAEDGLGAMDKERFRETIRLIRAHKDCDIIINCTSSGASKAHPATDEDRMVHFKEIDEIEMGSFDAGSFNWMPTGVFVNSPSFLENLGRLYAQRGIKPEIEIFDTGMLNITNHFVRHGILAQQCHFQFCLGVPGAMSATVENLLYLVDKLPQGATWSAFGVGSAHMSIMYATLALGGHIRVGLEDNVIFGKDENGEKIMATNPTLVARAAEAIRTYGNECATPNEARKILGIPIRSS